MSAATTQGIDEASVTRWFDEHTTIAPPLAFTPLPGGNSNLTFRVTDSDGRAWVLRRPPLGHVLATAHDMSREHRIIDALGPTAVPVPGVLGLCSDPAVNGAAFYVMEHVDGVVVRTPDEAETELAPAQRQTVGEELAVVLADLHAADVDAIGLGDLARRDAYAERQLKRWHRQLLDSATRELPMLTDLHDELAASVPPQRNTGLLHGDYRLDNTILDGDRSVAAVLDWELSTLGEPLADLGMTLAYWTEPGDDSGLPPIATDIGGFPTRAEFVARYAAHSGFDVSDLAYYLALAHWKIACIAEGVYSRFQAGVMGDKDVDMSVFVEHPFVRARLARAALDRGV